MNRFHLALLASWLLVAASASGADQTQSGDDWDCDPGQFDLLGRSDQKTLELGGATTDGVVTLDLFVMSLCPYGMEAERVLLPLIERFAHQVELRIHYIADVAADADDSTDGGQPLPQRNLAAVRMLALAGSSAGRRRCAGGSGGSGAGPFRSLHGQPEIDESIRQLLVKTDRPELHRSYVLCRARQGAGGDWRRCARAVGLVPDSLKSDSGEPRGQELFRDSISLANRLRIDLSPTLFVNGREYAGDYRGYALARTLCATLSTEPWCEQVPVCGRDEDCAGEPGQIALCEHPDTPRARCRSQAPVAFKLHVLNTDACPQCSTGSFLRTTLELFPGARVEAHLVQSPEGADLVAKYGIRALPAYVFGPEFPGSARFARVRSMLRVAADGHVVAPRISTVSYWPERESTPGRVVLFLPLWPAATEAEYLAPWLRRDEAIKVHHLVAAGLLQRPDAATTLPADLAWRVCAAAELPELYPQLVAAVAGTAPDSLIGMINSLGGDRARLERCVSSGAALRRLKASMSSADSLDLSTTDASALIGNRLLLRRASSERVAALLH